MIRPLLVAAILVTPALLTAETSCSANLAAPPSHASSNRYQVILEAYINDAGPYDFLLDTGSQVTIIDESLASELNIETTTEAAVVGVGLQGKAGKHALVNSVRVGGNANVEGLYVLALDMKEIHAAGYALRGLIGADFLAHFDATIDNTHNRVCLTKISD
jgi:predicted aspartyl protease